MKISLGQAIFMSLLCFIISVPFAEAQEQTVKISEPAS
jgi:hypothetical protein